MTIIFNTMDPSTATLCGYGKPADTDQGGVRIELNPGFSQETIAIFGQEGEVSFIGEPECRLAVEAMARALGYKLVKFGEDDKVRKALQQSAEGWTNLVELKLGPDRYLTGASILRDQAKEALLGEGQ